MRMARLSERKVGIEQYRVTISFDSEAGQYVASLPEVPDVGAGRARSRIEAISDLEGNLDSYVQQTAASGGELPRPIDVDDETYSGTVQVALGKTLHRTLAHRALQEGIAIETLAANAISSFLGGARAPRHAPASAAHPSNDDAQPTEAYEREQHSRSRRQQSPVREGTGNRYHQILEDKASFLEYVRQQERGFGNSNTPPRRRKQGRGPQD
jgi:predicted RNase H-like HicB family nuclease